MADYPIGGGGGPAGFGTENPGEAFDQPYDLYGPWSPHLADWLSELMRALTISATKNAAAIAALQATPAATTTSTDVWTYATITLTEPILEGLFVTPLVLAPAPGANLINVVQSLSVIVAHTDAYNAHAWNFAYTGSGAVVPFAAITTDLNNIRDKVFYRCLPAEFGLFTAAGSSGVRGVGGNVAAITNKAIEMSASVDPGTAGHANGLITITYRVIASPLGLA